MEITSDSLRRHYASLPDEALLEIDRTQLTEIAQACYDGELARRDLRPEPDHRRQVWPHEDEGSHLSPADPVFSPESDWLEDAVCVCAFEAQHHGIEQSSEAELAREALEQAQIPCEVALEELETPNSRAMPRYEYRVMVPAALSLKATSVLDIQIFNPKLEAEWRTHFEHLTGSELHAFDAQSLCAGLLDRAARLKRAYVDEVARRQLKARPADRVSWE
ncbi:MAG TPA: hypothetical protein VN428_17470 [Bryobacteraceae bacterium]|nr:hypothetical protein [Bryobacteraceae bacterium]